MEAPDDTSGMTSSSLVLRPATAADAADLERLAALDSARPLTGEVVLASVDGELRAALSLDTGRSVADPFHPSLELVPLLRTAAGERPARRATRRRLVRPALA
jgi:hypothetical protein